MGAAVRGPGRRRSSLVWVDVAELAGPAGLIEKRNTFRADDAVIEVAARSQQGATVEQLRSARDELLARADVFRTVDDSYTTLDLVGCERRLIESCTTRRSEDCARINPAQVARSCETLGRSLDQDQVAAVIELALGRRRRLGRRVRRRRRQDVGGRKLRIVYAHAGYNVIG
ncbi:MAG: hypothetical protein ACLP8S_10290 [Solirubrobacteraceae bacterium]